MFGIVMSLSMVVSLIFSLVGVMMSFVSLNLLGVWVGMELSFLSVICFASGSSVEETESMMKYFIIQVIGSCVSGMGFILASNLSEVMACQLFILIGMMVKLGVFPFHFWVAPVVSKLSWAGCASVLLVQKLIPIWVLSNYLILYKDVSRVEFFCCMTSLVGCLGGLSVLNYRVLLGFSSVQNLGPMVLLCCCENFELWVYVVVYFMLTGFAMMGLWQLGIYGFQDLVKETGLKGMDNLWWVSLYFLSSAGLPPFVGCAMKIALLNGCWSKMTFGTGICVLSSCISLMFYLSVVLAVVVYWGKNVFMVSKEKRKEFNYMVNISLLVNLSGGFIAFLWMSL
uniref:NADH-ubiquinone oxidoreductase chain 2 n=1 Tax=Ruditapes decussatus TaxID=104385 RepID=A0A219LUV1_9BIVA|nr:NADH dehydrogenase subunit 2 [Ruditapes decussatus]AJY78590.1 NADH dehydrogenase subunit 2 [Ruditapes decussatus]